MWSCELRTDLLPVSEVAGRPTAETAVDFVGVVAEHADELSGDEFATVVTPPSGVSRSRRVYQIHRSTPTATTGNTPFTTNPIIAVSSALPQEFSSS